MEEKQKSGGILASAAPFILGLVLALTFGWWIFPGLLFSAKQQPVAFKHSTHTELKDCGDCHYLRDDGSWAGFPSTETCAECHMDPQGDSKAELEYIRDYVEKEKEVKWLVHQYQPDNVFFSHAAHKIQDCAVCHLEWDPEQNDKFNMNDFCMTCHPSVEELDNKPVLENKLTGYSKTTMKMWQCERCHANPSHYGMTNSNNACYTCHK